VQRVEPNQSHQIIACDRRSKRPYFTKLCFWATIASIRGG
jgi:hypothetical protein